MNNVVKTLILYLSKTSGFIENRNLFLGLRITKELNELHDIIVKLTQKLATSKNVNNNDIKKLVADIESGAVSVEIIEDFEYKVNKKRMSKKRVWIDWGTVNDFAELAAWKMCNDCSKINKNCKLLKTYKNVNDYNIYAPCQAEQFESGRANII